MERLDRDRPSAKGAGFHQTLPRVEVHVLSEFVFCPRAAILAAESGQDAGDEEHRRGPKLDAFVDYDEHRFVEAIRGEWARMGLWLTLLAPALLLVLAAWRLTSPLAAAVAALPLFVLVALSGESLLRIARLAREYSAYRAAAPAEIDLTATDIRDVNWWSLRKAGFDCLMPRDPYRDHVEQLSGKPWRVLVKDTVVRIPVVRKHRGKRDWGKQHVIRLAAYCRLIEACEGADAPFGLLMFAGSYDCKLIPNTRENRERLERALGDVRRLLEVERPGQPPRTAAPGEDRCRGCHLGSPRKYVEGVSETELGGKKLRPLVTRPPGVDKSGPVYHCHCGDRFGWVPPHEFAVHLGIAQPR